MNTASLVLERARSDPDGLAIRFPAGRTRTGLVRYASASNRDLDRDSDALAHGFEAVGIGRGVRTAVMVKPSLELFAIMLALFKVGAIPVVVDPGIGLRPLRRCLDEAEPEAFVGIPAAQLARLALGWARRTLRVAVRVGGPSFLPGTALDELRTLGLELGAFPIAPTAADDDAAILFTSGSTGPPKGVVYTHGNFAAQVEAIRALGRIGPSEVDLPTFPPFALFDPALGMTAVVPDMDPTRPGRVDPRRILEPADRFGATNLFGSPALLDTVGRYAEQHGTRLTTLRRVVSAGAPVSAEIMARFLRLLPEDSEILTPYGATECLPVSCISSREVLGETASRTAAGAGVCVGRPVPSIEVRIIAIDDAPIEHVRDARELPVGEIGEIMVRGPQATAAYYGRPEANRLAKITDPDGFWHRMGDVGYFDSVGRLWYCGRKADRVETAQGTLHSIPCEAIFDTHPEVRRTALVGIAVPARPLGRPRAELPPHPSPAEGRPSSRSCASSSCPASPVTTGRASRLNSEPSPPRTRRRVPSKSSFSTGASPSTSGTTPRSDAPRSPGGRLENRPDDSPPSQSRRSHHESLDHRGDRLPRQRDRPPADRPRRYGHALCPPSARDHTGRRLRSG